MHYVPFGPPHCPFELWPFLLSLSDLTTNSWNCSVMDFCPTTHSWPTMAQMGPYSHGPYYHLFTHYHPHSSMFTHLLCLSMAQKYCSLLYSRFYSASLISPLPSRNHPQTYFYSTPFLSYLFLAEQYSSLWRYGLSTGEWYLEFFPFLYFSPSLLQCSLNSWSFSHIIWLLNSLPHVHAIALAHFFTLPLYSLFPPGSDKLPLSSTRPSTPYFAPQTGSHSNSK